MHANQLTCMSTMLRNLLTGSESGAFEEIVTHEPLLSAAIAPKLSARHEENSPTLQPLLCVRLSVDLDEQGHYGCAARVQIREPCVGCFFVVGTAPLPALFDAEVILEKQREVVARHDATGKKMSTHPIARPLIDEFIWQR